jgi:hypothetical protein
LATAGSLTSRGRRLLKRFALAATLAALSLAASGSTASAAVTIGQTAPPSNLGCLSGYDWVQPTVTSGNSYVVPGSGGVTEWTVTSWTTHGGPDSGLQMTMKMFRKVGEPARFQVVGHAGPQTVTPGGTAGNTFPANIAVKPGDVLGFYTPTSNYCDFVTFGEQYLFSLGDLADGAAAGFFVFNNHRLNVSAVITPTSNFTLGKTKRNKKKGTATITVIVPNPGELTASGKGVKASGAAEISKTVGAGGAKLVIRAKGKKKAKLNETGKVKVKPTITYTPTGGDPSTQSIKVKLKKNL